MGTHPIFESDFDCLTECQDMSRAKEMESLLPETALNAQLMADGSSTTGPSGVDPTQIVRISFLKVIALSRPNLSARLNSLRASSTSSSSTKLTSFVSTWAPTTRTGSGSVSSKEAKKRIAQKNHQASKDGAIQRSHNSCFSN